MQQMTPLKAIRLNCLDCMNGNAAEVNLCPMENKCSLWPFRFGTNPFNKKREYSEEYKQVLRERMKMLSEAKKKTGGV